MSVVCGSWLCVCLCVGACVCCGGVLVCVVFVCGVLVCVCFVGGWVCVCVFSALCPSDLGGAVHGADC